MINLSHVTDGMKDKIISRPVTQMTNSLKTWQTWRIWEGQNQNYIYDEIKRWMHLGNVCYHSVQILLPGKLKSAAYKNNYMHIMGVNKPRTTRGAGHAARKRKRKKCVKYFGGNIWRKRLFGEPWRWKDNIKMNLIRCEDVDWNYLI